MNPLQRPEPEPKVSKFAKRRARRQADKAARLEEREQRRLDAEMANAAWENYFKSFREQQRGVDRVPEHLRPVERERELVVEHFEPPFKPYVNPDRDKKRGARLRKEA